VFIKLPRFRRPSDPILNAKTGSKSVLLRADGSFRIFPARSMELYRFQKFVGRRVAVIDICGTFPSKATVMMINQDAARSRLPLNRRANILLGNARGAVRGDVVVALLHDPRGLTIRKLRDRGESVDSDWASTPTSGIIQSSISE
jgi:hypothetical protein